MELGCDCVSGIKVDYLSVIDDKSGYILATGPTIHLTIEHVIVVLADCFMRCDIPRGFCLITKRKGAPAMEATHVSINSTRNEA